MQFPVFPTSMAEHLMLHFFQNFRITGHRPDGK